MNEDLILSNIKSNRLQIFFKIAVLKNFANFTGKKLRWSLFLIKLQAFRSATLLKRNSNIGVFLKNLQNFWEHLFLQNTYCGYFSSRPCLVARKLPNNHLGDPLAIERRNHFIPFQLYVSYNKRIGNKSARWITADLFL